MKADLHTQDEARAGASADREPLERGARTTRLEALRAADLGGVAPETLEPRARQALLGLLGEVDRLREEADRLRAELAEISALADMDTLAPVYNRRAFLREFARLMSLADRYGMQAGLVFVDLDAFKLVNDTYGHQAGDEVIRHVADVLTRNVRGSDVVGRMGGDEFAVGLAAGGLDTAAMKAAHFEGLLRTLEVTHGNTVISVRASVGVVELRPGESAEAAIARADAAMYARKSAVREG